MNSPDQLRTSKELPEEPAFDVDEISPSTQKALKELPMVIEEKNGERIGYIALGRPGSYGFVEFTLDD